MDDACDNPTPISSDAYPADDGVKQEDMAPLSSPPSSTPLGFQNHWQTSQSGVSRVDDRDPFIQQHRTTDETESVLMEVEQPYSGDPEIFIPTSPAPHPEGSGPFEANVEEYAMEGIQQQSVPSSSLDETLADVSFVGHAMAWLNSFTAVSGSSSHTDGDDMYMECTDGSGNQRSQAFPTYEQPTEIDTYMSDVSTLADLREGEHRLIQCR